MTPSSCFCRLAGWPLCWFCPGSKCWLVEGPIGLEGPRTPHLYIWQLMLDVGYDAYFFPMWLILFQKDRLPFLHGGPREAFQHGGDRSHKALELAQCCFCHILLVKANHKISHNSEVGETLLLMRKAAKNLWLHLIY